MMIDKLRQKVYDRLLIEGMPREKLARDMGITGNTLKNFVNKKHYPCLSTVVIIGEYFEVNWDELFND